MKNLFLPLFLISCINVYAQTTQDGGIVGGYVDESKQSPELKEQIKKFREQGNVGTGYPGGIAGGAVSGGAVGGGYPGGIAGGYVDESKQSPELKEQIKKFREQGNVGNGYPGGVAGGAVSGGIAGGWIDSNLANCKKEDDGKRISCPDGEYVKSSSTNDSSRFPNIKESGSKKGAKKIKQGSTATNQ